MKTFFNILLFPFILLAIYIIARMMICSADWDVIWNGRTIEYAIGEKIMEQGYFPLSILELKDLPYELKNCKRDINQRTTTYNKKYIDIKEKCLVEINHHRYNFWYEGTFVDDDKNPDKLKRGRASFGIEKGRSSSMWGMEYSEKSNRIEPAYSSKPTSGCRCHTGLLCSNFKQ